MGLALPGTAYVTSASGVNATEYEQQFNSTQIQQTWTGTPFSGIPIVGDIFAGFSYLYQNIQYLVDGLPKFMLWIEDSYISDVNGRLAFEVVAGALRAIYAFLFAMWLIEFISGRFFSD